jgi:hypothetical protein
LFPEVLLKLKDLRQQGGFMSTRSTVWMIQQKIEKQQRAQGGKMGFHLFDTLSEHFSTNFKSDKTF